MKITNEILAKDLVHNNYLDYTIAVGSERALPDFADGLKPIQRKAVWAAYTMGLKHDKAPIKSAKLTGAIMGSFSPHASSYSSVVLLAQDACPTPLLDGQGNWGFLANGEAAAERYTEVRLSEFSEKYLLDEDYLAVSDMIPNYDDTTVEPLRLPALVPLLLLNGSKGIAVGTRTNIPNFTWKSLKPVVLKALEKEITWKDCKKLEFDDILNAKFAGTQEEFEEYLKNGVGTLKFTVETEIKDKGIHIYSLTSGIDTILDKLNKQDWVYSIDDMSNAKKIDIFVKPKPIYKNELEDIQKKIEKLLTNSINYSFATNMIEQTKEIDVELGDKKLYKLSAKYIETNIPNYINKWISYRLNLESKMLSNKIEKLKLEKDRLSFVVWSIDKLDVIFKVLQSKTENLEESIQKELKINKNQAKIICIFTVKQLSNLNKDTVNHKISELENNIKTCEIALVNVKETVAEKIKQINIKSNSYGKR